MRRENLQKTWIFSKFSPREKATRCCVFMTAGTLSLGYKLGNKLKTGKKMRREYGY